MPALQPSGADTAARHADTLVLDLDETVLFRAGGWAERARLYLLPGALVGVPYAGAAAAVGRLRGRFSLLAVTARHALAARNTRAWLDHHGFPADLRVAHARAALPGEGGRAAFKAAAIAAAHAPAAAAGGRLAAGVGDRPSDLHAYAAAGVAHAVMVVHAPPASVRAAGGAAREAEGARALAAYKDVVDAVAALAASADAAGGAGGGAGARAGAGAGGRTGADAGAGAGGSATRSRPRPRVSIVTDAPAVLAAAAREPPAGATVYGGARAGGGGDGGELEAVWPIVERLLLGEGGGGGGGDGAEWPRATREPLR